MDIAAINRKAFSTLKELLPKEDPFLITAFDELETGFQSTVRLQFDVAAQVDAWKEKLQQETMTTFRRSRLRTGPRGQKEYLYCHHGYVRERKEPPKRKTKQTGCMARMDLTLNFKSESKRQRYRYFYMPEWPCVVSIKWIHNHAINSASALVYRDVGENVKERLMTLFHEGHSPATAHSVLKQEAADVCEGQLYQLSDRQKLPTYTDVWRYHLKYFQEKYGRFSGPLSVESVSDAIEALAETSASNIRSRKTEDGSMVSAIVTPLMMRVHEHHPQSGELVFVDSSGGMDKYNTRVFLLMTSSSLGGLPLGCFLTNSEKKATIEEALRLLMDMLPSYAFFGRGAKGPCLLMTDNSVPEKEALGAVFPESRQYLCTFHVLQAIWRHLWDRRSGVSKEHRPHILHLMKDLLYTQAESELQDKWLSLHEDPVLLQYESMLQYFTAYWEIRREWAICFRQETLVRGSNTNNLVERAFLTLKDNILRRQKVVNVVQLVDSIDHFSRQFSYSIIDKIRNPGNVHGNTASQKAMLKGSDITHHSITSLGEDMFTVQGTDDLYTVNSVLGLCTCPAGITGAACKHQFAVRSLIGIKFVQHMPVDNEAERLRFYKIASGEDNLPVGWFNPLVSSSSCTPTPIASPSEVVSAPLIEACPSAQHNVQLSSSTQETNIENEVVECLAEFDDWHKKMKEQVVAHPELSHLLKKFVHRGNDLLSAGLAATASGLSSFFAITPRATGRYIRVQPTAVARRRHFNGSRRRVMAPVRGTKRDPEGPSILPPKSKKSRPHNLSDSVKKNVTLGKTHEKKMNH